MTRPRLLLLDANACICAHQCDGWVALQEKYDIFLPETVLKDEALYYYDGKGAKQYLQLQPEIDAGKIKICSSTPAEQASLLTRLHPSVGLRLHAGELEALAYLANDEQEGMAFVTGDGAAIQAAHGLGMTVISLEKLYTQIGQTKALRDDMTEDAFKDQIRRAGVLLAQGRLTKL